MVQVTGCQSQLQIHKLVQKMSRDARKQVFVVPEQVGHIAACIFPERVILAIMYTDHTYIAKQKAPISCAATAQSISHVQKTSVLRMRLNLSLFL